MNPRNRFLLATAAGAAATAAAWRPPDWFEPGQPLAFVASLPTSELPMPAMAMQGLAGLVAARGGGIRGVRGAVGLGLMGASLIGLTQLQREAARSDNVLEAALVAGLGERYRERIRDPFRPRSAVPTPRPTDLVRALNVRRRFAAVRDVPYGEHGRRNLLDIWRRSDLPPDAGAPVLLQIHGGAWVMGEKRGQAHPLMAHLTENGWVCVAINYRLSPRSTWPAHIVDVKRAIAWTRANIADHGGDPSFVAITGGSAGGHLAALAALTPGLADFQPGFEDADTSVAAAVTFYGVYDFTNRDGTAGHGFEQFLGRQIMKTSLTDDRATWEQASPMSHVRPDAPPFFILHGSNDSLVPVEQARSFAALLGAASRRSVCYAELPRAQHAFDLVPSVRTQHAVYAVERFLAIVRSEFTGTTRGNGERPATAEASANGHQ